MRFPASFLDEIRDRVPISDVIGTRVSWDKRKTNAARGDFWACCPFHGEKTPSFHCEDKKGRYHCFGCGVTGDHFRFLTELEGLQFPEAVERVAGMAGVPMPERDPEAEKREEQRASLYDVMELAVRFFEAQLQAAAGAKARAYLRDRGLSSATIQKFRLGYAPDSRNALKQHLADKGVAREQIEACGLVVFGDDIPVSYDRFRDRVMFPIADTRGRTVAFGGRALSADAPAKYLNSPETELFHKGDLLFNHARAREALRKGGQAVAVEGYMDVIALDQAGFANAVAPLGTALTENQLDLLWRMGSEPVLCFDGDAAGLRAANRAIDTALPHLKPGRTLKFALLPDKLDPDDIVRQRGPDAFAAVLAEARPLADMLWAREAAGKIVDTPERRAELEKTLKDIAYTIADESVRRHYLQDLRERMQAFFGQPAPSRRSGSDGSGQGGRRGVAAGRLAVTESLTRSRLVHGAGGQPPLREAVLVMTLVSHPDLLGEFFDAFDTMELDHPALRELRSGVLDVQARHPVRTRAELALHLADLGLSPALELCDALVRRARMWVATEDAAIEDAREGFLQALGLHRRARSLNNELRVAEQALADDPSEENFSHLLDIQAEIRAAQTAEALVEGFGAASGRPTRSF
ncbi:MAG TPA: DNA primase [Rhizobiaceae bacterium]|nr:DNA primase [Rhizobiaceae bacterium]